MQPDRVTSSGENVGFVRRVILAQGCTLPSFSPLRFFTLHYATALAGGLASAGSSAQEGDAYLEYSWINDEKLCLQGKMMKGKCGPASSAPRVQR